MSMAAVAALAEETSKLGSLKEVSAFAKSEEYEAMVQLKDEPRPTRTKSASSKTEANVSRTVHVTPPKPDIQQLQSDRRRICNEM